MEYNTLAIHSWFRNNGTYFWNKYRKCTNEYVSYCEPLHHHLKSFSNLNSEEINKASNYLHHYFNNFDYNDNYPITLNEEGFNSVQLFNDKFSYLNMNSTVMYETYNDLSNYLNNLKNVAINNNKKCVFKFCRTFSKVKEIKSILGENTIHIGILRNPKNSFLSYQKTDSQSFNLFNLLFVSSSYKLEDVRKKFDIIENVEDFYYICEKIKTLTEENLYEIHLEIYNKLYEELECNGIRIFISDELYKNQNYKMELFKYLKDSGFEISLDDFYCNLYN
jgi:hypothetical protein